MNIVQKCKSSISLNLLQTPNNALKALTSFAGTGQSQPLSLIVRGQDGSSPDNTNISYSPDHGVGAIGFGLVRALGKSSGNTLVHSNGK